MTLIAWHRQQRLAFRLLLAVFVLFTVLGNPHVASLAYRGLQGPFLHINPLDQTTPFDAVLVLGGSTKTRPSGYTQLTNSGDRVMLGARLHRQGLAQHLVTSGSNAGGRRSPADETREIWRQLGVPDEAILSCEGRITAEELASFAELVRQHNWQRLGLVTSAWHMRRALTHARRRQLTITPLPADFKGREPPWEDPTLIPDEQSLLDMRIIVHELVGMAVKR